MTPFDTKQIPAFPPLDVALQKNQADPGWLQEIRRQEWARLLKLGIPTVRNEDWKYTNVLPALGHTYVLSSPATLADTAVLQGYLNPKEVNAVFVNGRFEKKLSNLSGLPKGVKVRSLREILKTDTKGKGFQEFWSKYEGARESSFVALNRAMAEDGVYIEVAPKAICQTLIHVVHVTSAGPQKVLVAPRTFIKCGASSEATVLESHLCVSDEEIYFTDALTDILLAENAVLHYCKAQKESVQAYHIGHTRVWEEQNANFDGFSFMAGAALARNDMDIVLNGEGGNANLDGLYAVAGNQHVDNHTAVDHRVPNCTSNQLYKGILNGSSRSVFNGKIFVRAIAQKTNSYQLNKNLLLGKDCRVDTKPQLEIYADDVKCTHGATIGQLNEDEMFYLQTRCIGRKAARKMLTHAFVDDLLNEIQSESIHQKLNKLLEPTFEVLE